MDPADVTLCREMAAFYRSRGLNPLPSRPDAKRPMVRFREWWETAAPADLFDRHPTSNVQIMTGRHWRLLVIDLDGPEAIAHWAGLGQTPRTWVTHSGGGGRHLWFRLPPEYPQPLPKCFLWQGTEKHQAIERLCDHALVMAPPSIHPTTGQRYRFLSPGQSPQRLPMPADCPAWVLRLAPVVPVVASCPPLPPVVPRRAPAPSSRRYQRADVLAAIPDKLALVRSWGVRFTGRAGPSGWAPCHAVDRPDDHPSAAVHASTGTYCDLGSGVRLSLFDLAVTLGVYRDFHDAVSDLGATYYVHATTACR